MAVTSKQAARWPGHQRARRAFKTKLYTLHLLALQWTKRSFLGQEPKTHPDNLASQFKYTKSRNNWFTSVQKWVGINHNFNSYHILWLAKSDCKTVYTCSDWDGLTLARLAFLHIRVAWLTTVRIAVTRSTRCTRLAVSGTLYTESLPSFILTHGNMHV